MTLQIPSRAETLREENLGLCMGWSEEQKGPSSITLSLLLHYSIAFLHDTGEWEIIEPLAKDKIKLKLHQGKTGLVGATKTRANRPNGPSTLRLIPHLTRTPCCGDAD